MIKTILKKLRWKLFLRPVLDQLDELEYKIDAIYNKLSLSDDTVILKNAKFYVPNAPRDDIQGTQLSARFYEEEILLKLDKYLNENSVVLDIGANVGNHTVYWGKISKVNKIFAFEPVISTYCILEKNIEINNLSNKVKLFNIGLGDKKTRAKIDIFSIDNIGATSINEDVNGDIKICALDDIYEINNESRIDFIKIDVEGFEKYVLEGAKHILLKHSPIIFIESFPGKDTYDYTYNFLKEMGYSNPIKFPDDNYLFIKPP